MKQRFIFIVQPASYYFHGRLNQLKSNQFLNLQNLQLPPSEVRSTEQLYLTGLHLEQYRHATYNPTDYYLEAYVETTANIRNNNAMGLWLFRKGQFKKAELYLRKAINTLTELIQIPTTENLIII